MLFYFFVSNEWLFMMQFFCAYQIINFDLKIKFKKIMNYKFVIMCMFNTPNYYLYVDRILIYNISNNDTY